MMKLHGFLPMHKNSCFSEQSSGEEDDRQSWSIMRHTFGIIQPTYTEDIPGTFALAELASLSEDGSSITSQLKNCKQSDSTIVLVPQPSADPNDPLNWRPMEKRAVLWTVAVASAIVHTLGPIMGTSYQAIGQEFHQGLDRVVQAISGNFALTSGIGTVLVSGFAVCYGKRPAILFSVLASVALSIWIIFEKDFRGIIAARALQGLATSPLEVLGTALVSDIYFVHQRGSGLAVVGAVHLTLILVCQVAGGYIVQYLGWRRVFIIEAGMIAALLPAVFFLIPETTFDRIRSTMSIGQGPLKGGKPDDHLTHDITDVGRKKAASTASSCYSEMELQHVRSAGDLLDSRMDQQTYGQTWTGPKKDSLQPIDAITPRRFKYTRRLRIWNGKLQDENFWAVCLRPFPLVLHPAVLFGIFVHGLGSTWLLAFAFAKLKLFSAAPYHMTPCKHDLFQWSYLLI